MGRRVVAIVGSYRKGGRVDSAIQAILDGAREKGAETNTIYLTDKHIEFCTNCRRCTQDAGTARGVCPQHDDMNSILNEIENADAIVLGSPVNFWNVTAIYRRFLERLVAYAYWPWGNPTPSERKKIPSRKAALVASCAAPGFCIPLLTGAARALRGTAKLFGAKTVGSLWIGFSAMKPNQPLSPHTLARARRIGLRLV